MSDLVGNPEDRFSRVAAHIVKFTFDLYIQMIPSKDFVSQQCTYSSSSFCSRLGIETFTVSLGCLLPDISDIRALELAGKTV